MLSANGDEGCFSSQPVAKFDGDIIRTSKSLNKVGMGASRASEAKNFQRMGKGLVTKS